ncbi:MAG: DUF488 domain-containing protein [Bryobacterales bacterium]|nr:DUF488 domain-containing protein [Bryobacterales bacterium]
MSGSSHLSLPSAPAREQLAKKCSWNGARSAEKADFFTLGYTGRKTEEIIRLLKENGVRTLVDIRKNAVSMYRPELSKGNLARLLEEHDLLYAHVPDLGVPRDVRAKAIEAGSREVIWQWYDRNVAGSMLSLHFFMNGFEHPVALMCAELDPHECHRHRLSLALEAHGLNSFDL